MSTFSTSRDIITVRADLKRLTKDLEQSSADFAVARRKLAETSTKYEIGYAKMYSYTDPSGKVADRESEATLRSEQLLTDKAVAEAETEILKQHIRVLSDVLNATQTLGSLLKSEAQTERNFSKL